MFYSLKPLCRFISSFFLQILVLNFFHSICNASGGKHRLIGWTQFAVHPSLDQIREGFDEQMKTRGFSAPFVTVETYNAAGSTLTAAQIANQLKGKPFDVLISITTPMSQEIVKKKYSIPTVFSAVNDPIDAKLLSNLTKPEGWVTGLSHQNPIKKQIEMMKQILPNLKTIGFLYSSAEQNSLRDKILFEQIAKEFGLEVKSKAITHTTQIPQTTQELASAVGAIYFPTDSTVVSSVDSVLKVCEGRKIPAFSADSDSVKKGALLTLALDHKHIGVMTADLVIDLFQGKKISDIPVRNPDRFELTINEKTAKDLGIQIPKVILDQKPVFVGKSI